MPYAGDRPFVSLVIPAFNEEEGIAQAIREADDALRELGHEYEILVVDDGSRDGTFVAATAEAADRPEVRVLRHERNRGYGSALRTGFEAARGHLVAFTDADCQFDLTDLRRLIPLTRHAPIAVGYRLDRKDPWRRRFLSAGYNLLIRWLLGTRVRDVDCALKVFRRDELQHILPNSCNFFVNTEMLTRARQCGMEVRQVGVRHRPRRSGQSKVSLGDVPRTLRTLLPFWWSQVMFPRRHPNRPAGWMLPLLVLTMAWALVARQSTATENLESPSTEAKLAMSDSTQPERASSANWAGIGTIFIAGLWGLKLAGLGPAAWGTLLLAVAPIGMLGPPAGTETSVFALVLTISLAAVHWFVSSASPSGWPSVAAGVAVGLFWSLFGPLSLLLVLPPFAVGQWLGGNGAGPTLLGWRNAAFWAILVRISSALSDLGTDVWSGRGPTEATFDLANPGFTAALALWGVPLLLAIHDLGRHQAADRRSSAQGTFFLIGAWLLGVLMCFGRGRLASLAPVQIPLALALGCTVDAWMSWLRSVCFAGDRRENSRMVVEEGDSTEVTDNPECADDADAWRAVRTMAA